MRLLISLLVCVACSLPFAARGDITCVAAPAKGECVVQRDGSVTFSRDAADRVSAAAAETVQLRTKVAATVAALDSWRAAYGLSAAAYTDLKTATAAKDVTLDTQSEVITAQRAALDSWTHSPWVYVGVLVLGFAGGIAVTR
jgi:hypothetical protein